MASKLKNLSLAYGGFRQGSYEEQDHEHTHRGFTKVKKDKNKPQRPQPPPLPSQQQATQQQQAPQGQNGGQGYQTQQGQPSDSSEPRTSYNPDPAYPHNSNDPNAGATRGVPYFNGPEGQQPSPYTPDQNYIPTRLGENADYYTGFQAGSQQYQTGPYNMPSSSPPEEDSPVPMNRRNRGSSDTRGLDLGPPNPGLGLPRGLLDQGNTHAYGTQPDPYYQQQPFQQYHVAVDYQQPPPPTRPEYYHHTSDPLPEAPTFSFPQQNDYNSPNTDHNGHYRSDFGSEAPVPSRPLNRSHTVAGYGVAANRGPSPGMCPTCGKFTDGPWHCETCGYF